MAEKKIGGVDYPLKAISPITTVNCSSATAPCVALISYLHVTMH